MRIGENPRVVRGTGGVKVDSSDEWIKLDPDFKLRNVTLGRGSYHARSKTSCWLVKLEELIRAIGLRNGLSLVN